MAYQDNGFQNRPRPEPVDVSGLNITCSTCGQAITTLPFNPTVKEDGTYGKLFCQECNRQRMKDRGPRRSFGGGSNYGGGSSNYGVAPRNRF